MLEKNEKGVVEYGNPIILILAIVGIVLLILLLANVI